MRPDTLLTPSLSSRLSRLTDRKEQEKPGFAIAVEKRKGELLLAARLREAREIPLGEMA